jgi:hypothetical protein
VAKQQENYSRTDSATQYKSPPLYLNLYILFSINKPEYDDCLKWLGHIMQFFQHQQVFTPSNVLSNASETLPIFNLGSASTPIFKDRYLFTSSLRNFSVSYITFLFLKSGLWF